MYNLVVWFCLLAGALGYNTPNTAFDRTAMVHLFEWPWNSIANECESFLAPHGFGGVQISPPNEHRVIYAPYWDPNVKRPWYESYQPISYGLNSRRGTEQQFADMVRRCNDVGVRIYVDAVVNHMCGEDAGVGTGSGGSAYNTGEFSFPGAGYSSNDFNQPLSRCKSSNGQITNYGDINEVRDCNLVGLLDLYTGSAYVRGQIASYFNKVIDLGVAGFRVDAAKHMWPGDIEAILGMTNDLNTAYFPANTRPFFFHEVIDKGGEPVKALDYINLGRVTDFIYGESLGNYFKNLNNLGDLWDFGKGKGAHWDLDSDKALVFVDNHDNQRGHGGGGNILTHSSPDQYKQAVAFMMAWPYGFPRIMSSYKFNEDWQGPPSDFDYNVIEPTFNADGSCSGDWICEHRWRPIANMVGWRNQAGSSSVENFQGGQDWVHFSRGSKAFIAIARYGTSLSKQVQTGLPAGEYCNLALVDYDSSAGTCTGSSTVSVDSSGNANIYISGQNDDTLLYVHVGALKNGPIVGPTNQPTNQPSSGGPTQGPTQGPNPTSPTGSERTVIFMYKPTSNGQFVTVRGGIDTSRRSGCGAPAESDNCAIPITHLMNGDDTFNKKKAGDHFLDWHGKESGQDWDTIGTPMVWTTNDANYYKTVENDGYGYTPLNKWGEHYWMVELDVDCSKTEEGGWFELKGLLAENEWESNRQQGECSGSKGGKPLLSSAGNHFALCGHVNVFQYNEDFCQIDNL
nr:alpha-amylase 2-like [Lytechinus pictus]